MHNILIWLIAHAHKKYTPKKWCALLYLRILDADGWSDKDISIPVRLEEFMDRLSNCTIKGKPEN